MPHTLAGEHVIVRLTDATAGCFFNGRSVAVHARSYSRLGSLPYTELDSAPTIGIAPYGATAEKRRSSLMHLMETFVQILGRAQYVATPIDSAE